VNYDFRIAARPPAELKELRQKLLRGYPDRELEYMREGMRSMETHMKAYEGASPEQVEQISTGKIHTMNSRSPFEPVKFMVEPGQVILVDGRHRMQAALASGAKHILAEIRYPNDAKETKVIPIPK
jgi:hypothetical protein